METTVENVSNVVFSLVLGSTDCIALCMHGNNDPVAAALHIILGDTLRVRPIVVPGTYIPTFLSLMAKKPAVHILFSLQKQYIYSLRY
jgi:hypothetical protein